MPPKANGYMMQHCPKVSVCLLVYNYEHGLPATIESILQQSLRDFEFIISDDCSTDGSWKVIEECAGRNKNILPLRTGKNLGMAGNANFAISQARGEFVALLHQDDLAMPRLLEKWLEIAERSEKMAFVFNDYRLGDIHGTLREGNLAFPPIMDGKYFLKKILLKTFPCVVRGTGLIRKKYFESVHGFDLRFGLLADIDLWMRLSARWDVGYVAEPLLVVTQERSCDYPSEYTGFSWKRELILFDIHANNILRETFESGFEYRWMWIRFRMKASLGILRIVASAVRKNRRSVIEEAKRIKCAHEYSLASIFRKLLIRIYELACG